MRPTAGLRCDLGRQFQVAAGGRAGVRLGSDLAQHGQSFVVLAVEHEREPEIVAQRNVARAVGKTLPVIGLCRGMLVLLIHDDAERVVDSGIFGFEQHGGLERLHGQIIALLIDVDFSQPVKRIDLLRV